MNDGLLSQISKYIRLKSRDKRMGQYLWECNSFERVKISSIFQTWLVEQGQERLEIMILHDHISPTFKFQKPDQCPFILQEPFHLCKRSLEQKIQKIFTSHKILQNVRGCNIYIGYIGKLTNLADTSMPLLQQCIMQSLFIHNVIFSNFCYVIPINLITPSHKHISSVSLRAMCNIVTITRIDPSEGVHTYFNVTSRAFPNYEEKKLLCNRHYRIYVDLIERGMRKWHLKVHST